MMITADPVALLPLARRRVPDDGRSDRRIVQVHGLGKEGSPCRAIVSPMEPYLLKISSTVAKGREGNDNWFTRSIGVKKHRKRPVEDCASSWTRLVWRGWATVATYYGSIMN